jgi:hypothetical protein
MFAESYDSLNFIANLLNDEAEVTRTSVAPAKITTRRSTFQKTEHSFTTYLTSSAERGNRQSVM